MIVQKECPQCGNLNHPDDSFCRECIFELKEYNLKDLKIKEHQQISLNIMIIIILLIGFMILVTFTFMIQYFVQEVIPFLTLWPIEIGFIL